MPDGSAKHFDSFGQPAKPGDLVVTSSSANYTLKIGRLYVSDSGTLMIDVEAVGRAGRPITNFAKRQPLGNTFAVLRSSDGYIPFHIWTAINGTHELPR